MYKSKLQELCQRRQLGLPEYTAGRDGGADHMPRFRAAVTVGGATFHSPADQNLSSLRKAQNAAAKLALDHFLSLNDNPTFQPSIPTTDLDNQVSFKTQLQHYVQRKFVDPPIYTSAQQGPQHNPQFKAIVKVAGRSFESQEFFRSIKEAEHNAAKIALMSLPLEEETKMDEPGFYKNLLQEWAQKEDLTLPTYTTTKKGPSHMTSFFSVVEVAGKSFEGSIAKTRKQAEKNAAKVAWDALQHESASFAHTNSNKDHHSSGRKDPMHCIISDNEEEASVPTSWGHTGKSGIQLQQMTTPSPENLYLLVERRIGDVAGGDEVTEMNDSSTNALSMNISLGKGSGLPRLIGDSDQSEAPFQKPETMLKREDLSRFVLPREGTLSPSATVQSNLSIDIRNQVPFKSQLQNFVQRKFVDPPVYECIRDGPPHNPRFKAIVVVGGQRFESVEFFRSIKEAKHNAAKVAVMSLPQEEETKEYEPGIYKNLLQELVEKEGLTFPKYTTKKKGPSHMSAFSTTVEVNGEYFEGFISKTKKQAEINAAKVACNILQQRKVGVKVNRDIKSGEVQGTPKPPSSRPTNKDVDSSMQPRAPSPGKPSGTLQNGIRDIAEHQVLGKSQLQSYVRRKMLDKPVYKCVREGPMHKPRFRANVRVAGSIFESRNWFCSLREAEHDAAKVALKSLPQEDDKEDEPLFYKNLLHLLAQKEGLLLPKYTTISIGTIHMPVFSSTVEIGGESFKGDIAKTKKQAETNAARSAWDRLQESRKNKSQGSYIIGSEVHQAAIPTSSKYVEKNIQQQISPSVTKSSRAIDKRVVYITDDYHEKTNQNNSDTSISEMKNSSHEQIEKDITPRSNQSEIHVQCGTTLSEKENSSAVTATNLENSLSNRSDLDLDLDTDKPIVIYPHSHRPDFVFSEGGELLRSGDTSWTAVEFSSGSPS